MKNLPIIFFRLKLLKDIKAPWEFSAHLEEVKLFKPWNFFVFFFFPDPETQLNTDPFGIRIRNLNAGISVVEP